MNDRQNELRRLQLLTIVQEHFAGNINFVLSALKEATGQSVSLRTIQTWMIAPHRISHRKVPDWAIRGLEEYVRQPDNQAILRRHRDSVADQRKQPPDSLEHAHHVYTTDALDFATSEVESEAQDRGQWQRLFGLDQGNALFQTINAQRREISLLSKTLSDITRELKASSTFEEFKTRADKATKAQSIILYAVREARKDLEHKIVPGEEEQASSSDTASQ